jgi:branched-subunit amino acid ABC-type transport system permease component
MENIALSKKTTSFGLSLALCAVLNALVVIAKERSKSVADWMQKVTGHHWITHVAVLLLLYAIFGWCFARTNHGQGPKMSAQRLTGVLLTGVIAGVVIILAFYVIAD